MLGQQVDQEDQEVEEEVQFSATGWSRKYTTSKSSARKFRRKW
jgi:hypothetical protein